MSAENKSNSENSSSADKQVCKHCGKPMDKWGTPQLTNWESEWFWVCFNDKCEYYQKGWSWMMSKYKTNTSYRYRVDPLRGEAGPLPVWSEDALKNGIIEE